jgi:hypothetical protein
MFTGSSSLFGAISLTVHLASRMLFCSFSVNLSATMAMLGEQRRGTRNLHARTRNIARALKTLKTLPFFACGSAAIC